MKKYISVIFLLTSILCGCSSNTNQNTARQNVAETNVNPVETPIVKTVSPTPPTAQTPTKTLAELEKINREAFTSPPPKPTRTPVRRADSNSTLSLESRPAPDDSTVSSTINSKGQPVEMRVFNHNQFLIKIERIYITPEQKILKVYLKSGKVVELQEDQIPKFDVASVSAILNAAGTVE